MSVSHRPSTSRPMTRIASSAVAAAVLLGVVAAANPALASTPQVTEFLVPSGGAPSGIAIGSDGAVWFAELAGGSVGRLKGGTFSMFSLPTSGQPEFITEGPDGALWFTDAKNSVIWRITTGGRISHFVIPPCTGCVYSGGSGTGNIALGPDGALWYSRPGNDAIGRITTTGEVREFPVTGLGSVPGWITSGPDGAIWFTVSNGIARMTTDGQVSLVWDGLNYAYAITTGPDGNLWFTGFYQDVVGRISTAGAAKLFPLGTSSCAPQEIASANGALWVTCYESNFVYRVSVRGAHTAIAVPSHFVSLPDGLDGVVGGPGEAIWFTQAAASRLGRITP